MSVFDDDDDFTTAGDDELVDDDDDDVAGVFVAVVAIILDVAVALDVAVLDDDGCASPKKACAAARRQVAPDWHAYPGGQHRSPLPSLPPPVPQTAMGLSSSVVRMGLEGDTVAFMACGLQGTGIMEVQLSPAGQQTAVVLGSFAVCCDGGGDEACGAVRS